MLKNTSNKWIELGLSRPGPAAKPEGKDLVPTFAAFARELLALIGDIAPEVEEAATANFRRQLGRLREYPDNDVRVVAAEVLGSSGAHLPGRRPGE